MASGFATIENDGYYRTPTCIVKIEDGNGTVLYNSGQNPVLIYKKNAARMMTDVLKGVITNGTGKDLTLEICRVRERQERQTIRKTDGLSAIRDIILQVSG